MTVSGSPVSGSPVSGSPVSGSPVSGSPVSGSPVSGSGSDAPQPGTPSVPDIVCVGDVMVDVVARLPGELEPGSDRPAPIRAGGGGAAANTACWLAAAGARATLVGAIGRDAFGDWMVADLRAAGVIQALVRVADRPTGTCIVLVSPDGERTMVPDAGANDALQSLDLPAELFDGRRHLHLSGYTLFGRARAAGRHALRMARAGGLSVSVDAASVAPLRAVGAPAFLDWIGCGVTLFANRDEAAALTASSDPEHAARELGARLGAAVIKVGRDGAIWSDGVRYAHRDAVAGVEPVDTTGAGDAFAAGFLAASLAGAEPADALVRGHELAARACRVVGGRPPG